MLARLKVVQVSNFLGATFTKELTTNLEVERGDMLFVTEAPVG